MGHIVNLIIALQEILSTRIPYLTFPPILPQYLPMYVQLGIIGAVQRFQPAVAELFLRWTGVQELHLASLGVEQLLADGRPSLVSKINLGRTESMEQSRDLLCDWMNIPLKSEARRKLSLSFDRESEAHQGFWEACRARQQEIGQCPLEFLWCIHLLRSRRLRVASQRFLVHLFGQTHASFDQAVVRLRSEINLKSRTVKQLLGGGKYRQPGIQVLFNGSVCDIDIPVGLVFDSLFDLAVK